MAAEEGSFSGSILCHEDRALHTRPPERLKVQNYAVFTVSNDVIDTR